MGEKKSYVSTKVTKKWILHNSGSFKCNLALMLQRIASLTYSRWCVRSVCMRMSSLVEFCKALHSRCVPFHWDFNLRHWSILLVSQSPYRHMKSSIIFYASEGHRQYCNKLVLVFFFLHDAQLNLSHCQVKQGSGQRKRVLSVPCKMMKQAVCAVLSHAFNPINVPWKALELTLTLKRQNAASTSVNLFT